MKLICSGVLVLIAGFAMFAVSLVPQGVPGAMAGQSTSTPSPTASPDPTIDPCDTFKPPLPATCVPTQPARDESTNTPTRTATPEEELTAPPSTPVPGSTTAPPPPAASPTPAGGAGGGGVAPPDTGAGTGEAGTGTSWFIALGALFGVAGLALVSYGALNRR